MNKIKVENLSKRYPNVQALDNVSLSFKEGKIYGILGRNGAGKSTLINIIANRVIPNSGTITIDGLNARENSLIREKLFCMSEADYYDKDMKVKHHYRWTQEFYDDFDLDTALELASLFNLNTESKFSKLSKGYKSIFKLTIALSLDLPYIIYDEPIQGLDANHRTLFYKLLLEDYQESGRTIIIATHLIEEISNLIEDIIIIDSGKILVDESVETLLSKAYSVSGKSQDVEDYIKGKNVIGLEDLGSLKLAYLLEEDKNIIPETLESSQIPLQKLFVLLTSKRGEIYED